MISNRSPLRYPGGKTRACKKLEEILIEHFDMDSFDTVISPFLGGASFEFHLQKRFGYKIVANDKFRPLYNFWTACKENRDSLCEKIRERHGKVGKKEFLEMRAEIASDELSPDTEAEYFFIINRCSFSGATLSGGFSLESSKKRFTLSSIDRIEKLNLSDFTITNQDFTDFIKADESSSSLIFLDPPYYLPKKSNRLYGNNGDLHESFNHMELYETVKGKSDWIMTYNNCDFIKDLYKDYTIIETSWTYGCLKFKEINVFKLNILDSLI